MFCSQFGCCVTRLLYTYVTKKLEPASKFVNTLQVDGTVKNAKVLCRLMT